MSLRGYGFGLHERSSVKGESLQKAKAIRQDRLEMIVLEAVMTVNSHIPDLLDCFKKSRVCFLKRCFSIVLVMAQSQEHEQNLSKGMFVN